MSKIYEALLRAEEERTGSTRVAGTTTAIQELFAPTTPDTSQQLEEPEPPSTFGSEAFAATQHALTKLEGVIRPWKPELTALPSLEPRGAAVEQFRSLRSHITEFREQRPLKSLLISSGLPGEGKSSVALNLALSFARHRSTRVLLIDGDMRRSSLDRLLGAPKEPGLSEYLMGTATLEEVLQQPDMGSASIPAAMASLSFIGGGRDADKAGDLAASKLFPELLQRVAPHFEWVLVDSPPVNLVSDAASMSRACDGVLLVSREGVTRFKSAQQALAQFKQSDVLGFVLNAMHNLPKTEYYNNYGSYGAEVARS